MTSGSKRSRPGEFAMFAMALEVVDAPPLASRTVAVAVL